MSLLEKIKAIAGRSCRDKEPLPSNKNLPVTIGINNTETKLSDLMAALTTVTGDMIIQIDASPSLCVEGYNQCRVLFANNAAKSILKIPPSVNVAGQLSGNLAHYNPSASDLFFDKEKNLDAWQSDAPLTAIASYSSSSGFVRTFEFVRATVYSPVGQPSSLVIIARDISAIHHAAQAAAISEQYAQAAIDSLSASICVLDMTGTIVHSNTEWRGLPGWNTQQNDFFCYDYLENNYLHMCRAAGEASAECLASGVLGVLSGRLQNFACEYNTSGEWFRAHATGCSVDGDYFAVVVHENITGIKSREEKILFEATHDKMSGLLNRTFYEGELVRLAGRRDIGVMVIDLDGLKHVNDTYGHDAGDHLIKSAALCLQRAFRSEDRICRIGGDEFLIFVTNANMQVFSSIIDRIRREESNINRLAKNKDILLKMSIGAALCGDAENLTDVVKKADQRMYLEKTARKHPAKQSL